MLYQGSKSLLWSSNIGKNQLQNVSDTLAKFLVCPCNFLTYFLLCRKPRKKSWICGDKGSWWLLQISGKNLEWLVSWPKARKRQKEAVACREFSVGTSYGLENFHHYHFLTDPWQKSVLTELWIVLREEGNRSIILLLPPLLHSQATSTLYKLPAAILYGITLHSGTLRWLYTTWIYFGKGIVSLLLPPTPTNTTKGPSILSNNSSDEFSCPSAN